MISCPLKGGTMGRKYEKSADRRVCAFFIGQGVMGGG